MGEYAEMMLDGTCCMQCGEYIDQDFPGLCASCKREERSEPRVPRFNPHKVRTPKKQQPGDAIRSGDRMSCPFCVARPKVTGFGDHMLTQHRDKWPSKAGPSS